MSVIAVEGLPQKLSLTQVVKMLVKSNPNNSMTDFNALNFVDKGSSYKTCYLQLSEKLDPQEVIENINKLGEGKKNNAIKAYVMEELPDLPNPMQHRDVFKKVVRKLGNAEDSDQVLTTAHLEIMNELQYKYTGLYVLSSKSSHMLLETIGMTIYKRLKQLMADGSGTSFLLTGRYRKAHPHFGDFQLILSTLHRIQDGCGAPRTQLHEAELMAPPRDHHIVDNISITKAQEACTKYTEKIIKRLEEHVSKYDLSESSEDNDSSATAAAARRRVRRQFASMVPYLPLIMKQVVGDSFTQDNYKNKCIRMRIYGEPSLPGREQTAALMKQLNAQRVARGRRVYNLLVFDVPQEAFARAMAADGTTLGDSKLVVRPAEVKLYRMLAPGAEPDDGAGGDARGLEP